VKAFAGYLNGDWGEISEHDKKANDTALEHGGRLFAKYKDVGNTKFWITTEPDRSCTTILLPEDY
jgi:hypothetical protein